MKNKKTSPELLSKRVFFKNDKIRNQFFAALKTRFGSWKSVQEHFKLYKSRLDTFRSATRSIPYSMFLNFIACVKDQDKNFFFEQIVLKEKDWGRRKGGVSTSRKHPDIFRKGRKLGAQSAKVLKYHFKFDMPLTLGLCELIGAFIGDGFTNKYGGAYTIQFTGHAQLDKEYYTTLMSYIKGISPRSNPILTSKENALRLTIHSKEFHYLLTKRFKFPAGKKAYSVVIPDEILKADSLLLKRCIRGIFDTDGSVYWDKRATFKVPYIRIGLQMVSKHLMAQIYDILRGFEINATITSDFRKIQINGVQNCKRFIEIVGFSNQRHLSKLKDT
ncbi:MAG: LAGLIDADG family homing endonuclease [Nanoarchaeota archaeon]